jgi:hypothetical protein
LAFLTWYTIQALDPAAGTIRVERSIEEGRQIGLRLPAVVAWLKISLSQLPSFLASAFTAVIPPEPG